MPGQFATAKEEYFWEEYERDREAGGRQKKQEECRKEASERERERKDTKKKERRAAF